MLFPLPKVSKNQWWQSWVTPSDALFIGMHLQKGPSTFLTGDNLASVQEHFCRVNNVPKECIVSVSDCKWVTLHGTKYLSNECSWILRSENENPVFGDLLGIWVANDTDVLFRVAELETIRVNHSLNSYKVEKLGQAQSALNIAPRSLLTHEVVHKWQVDHKLFINTKHDLSDLCDSWFNYVI